MCVNNDIDGIIKLNFDWIHNYLSSTHRAWLCYIRAHVCITLLTHSHPNAAQALALKSIVEQSNEIVYILIRCRPLSLSPSLSPFDAIEHNVVEKFVELYAPSNTCALYQACVCYILYINRGIGCWLNGYLAQSELIACASIRSTAQQAKQNMYTKENWRVMMWVRSHGHQRWLVYIFSFSLSILRVLSERNQENIDTIQSISKYIKIHTRTHTHSAGV